MSDFVLVIMPAYNREVTIKDSIISILKQSHTKLMLVVVNDGSTDNTVKVVEEIASLDHRVHLISRPRKDTDLKTASNAINYGLKKFINCELIPSEAMESFIAFTQVHSDDFLHRESIEKRLKSLILDKEIDAVYTDAIRFSLEDNTYRVWKGEENANLKKLRYVAHIQNIPNFTMMWRLDFIRDTFLREKQFYDPNFVCGEDRDVTSKTIKHCISNNKSLKYLPGYNGSLYREHSDSITQDASIVQKTANLRAIDIKHFTRLERVLLFIKRVINRPTYRLPYKFRKKYLIKLERHLYGNPYKLITPDIEKEIYWFR